jgi:hypothetical protein
MPRYFFHLEGRPEEGTDLPDLATAKCEAVRFAGTIICDEADQFWDAPEFSMIVTDEKGLLLLNLTLCGTEAPAIRNYPHSASGTTEI